jgi:bacillithiol biosynthesis deacetylase BshB1
MTDVDILAIAAHRDDVELTCGGTIIKSVRQGHRCAIIDLTAGETGTHGSAALRGKEADAASRILGVEARVNLGLPDAGLVNTPETRALLAVEIRKLRPRVVIAPPLNGRHPDHIVAAQLIRDACFIAGLAKIAPEVPAHRPKKIIHALAFREDYIKPTFVVDISDVFEEKLLAVRCYASQFDHAIQAGEVYPTGESLYDVVRHQSAHYGSLIRSRYGEPFYTTETMCVDDVATLGVATF